MLLPDEQGVLRVLVSEGHSERYDHVLARSPENVSSAAVLALRDGKPVQKQLVGAYILGATFLTPKGKDVLVAQAQFAKPGSGFFKGYADVQKAFQDAFTLEIQNKTYNADTVIAATKAAVDKALAS